MTTVTRYIRNWCKDHGLSYLSRIIAKGVQNELRMIMMVR